MSLRQSQIRKKEVVEDFLTKKVESMIEDALRKYPPVALGNESLHHTNRLVGDPTCIHLRCFLGFRARGVPG